MAEMYMKYLVESKGLADQFFIDSAATTREEIGNGIHRGTRNVLSLHNIPFTDHRAKLVKLSDYDEFDFIICMDQENLEDLNYIFKEDSAHKIYKLLKFCGKNRDVADPWYTGNFDLTYDDVSSGCKSLLDYILKN